MLYTLLLENYCPRYSLALTKLMLSMNSNETGRYQQIGWKLPTLWSPTFFAWYATICHIFCCVKRLDGAYFSGSFFYAHWFQSISSFLAIVTSFALVEWNSGTITSLKRNKWPETKWNTKGCNIVFHVLSRNLFCCDYFLHIPLFWLEKIPV